MVAEVERIGFRQPLEEDVVGGLVAIAERPDRGGDARRHRELEQRVAGVGREGREDVRAHHRHDHRPVAARRLAGDRAMVAVRRGRVALVDERHDLLAEVGLVAAGPGRVEELRSAVARPAVDHHDDRVGTVLGGEHRVHALDEGRLERAPARPHVELSRVALDHVDAGQGPGMIELDAGRAQHVQRPPGRVAERVVGEDLGLDDEAVERAGERPAPGPPEVVALGGALVDQSHRLQPRSDNSRGVRRRRTGRAAASFRPRRVTSPGMARGHCARSDSVRLPHSSHGRRVR